MNISLVGNNSSYEGYRLLLLIGNSMLGTLDIYRLDYVTVMVADGLAPNRRQAISNNHVDLKSHIVWSTPMPGSTLSERDQEVGHPLVSLLLSGLLPHNDHARWSMFMTTSSNGNVFRVTGPVCGSPVNSPHKGQWRGALCFLWSVPQ